MIYEVFEEEKNTIHYSEYERVREKITKEYGKATQDKLELRQQLFYKKQRNRHKNANTVFGIEWDKRYRSCTFSKKTKQEHFYYVAKETITKDECENISKKNIRWMRKKDNPLFYEFCFLYEQGEIQYDLFTEFKKESYTLSENSLIYFIHKLRFPKYEGMGFFKEDIPMIECISCDQVIASVQKTIHMPVFLTNTFECEKRATTVTCV